MVIMFPLMMLAWQGWEWTLVFKTLRARRGFRPWCAVAANVVATAVLLYTIGIAIYLGCCDPASGRFPLNVHEARYVFRSAILSLSGILLAAIGRGRPRLAAFATSLICFLVAFADAESQ